MDDLRAVFGLTARQAALAGLLGSGASLESAARGLAISKETARTHLRAIFERTETSSQVQLVALIQQLRH